jgi:hypothetical protein
MWTGAPVAGQFWWVIICANHICRGVPGGVPGGGGRGASSWLQVSCWALPELPPIHPRQSAGELLFTRFPLQPSPPDTFVLNWPLLPTGPSRSIQRKIFINIAWGNYHLVIHSAPTCTQQLFANFSPSLSSLIRSDRSLRFCGSIQTFRRRILTMGGILFAMK